MIHKLRYTIEKNEHEIGVWDTKLHRFICNSV